MMVYFVYVCMWLGFAKTPEKGALTTINCAINPTLNSQQVVYYSNCKPDRAPATAM